MLKRVPAYLAMLVVVGFLAACSSPKPEGTGSTEGTPAGETTPAADAEGQAAMHAEDGMEGHEAGTGVHAVATMTNDKGEMVVVGNDKCPVSDHEVKPGYGYAMEFNGKKVNLCCEDCVGAFEKDPEAMAKKAGVI